MKSYPLADSYEYLFMFYVYVFRLTHYFKRNNANFSTFLGGTTTVVTGNLHTKGNLCHNPKLFQINITATASQNHSYTDFLMARPCEKNKPNICRVGENDCNQNRRCNGKIELNDVKGKG